MQKLMTLNADVYILKNSIHKLSKGFLEKEKIRGLVCSENKGVV